MRARIYPKLKINVYPIKAPTPIQYQYVSLKNPRDFKTSTPIDSVELGRTFHKITYIKTSSDYLYDKEVIAKSTCKIVKKLTCFHLFPRNSLFTMAFCAYIIGDIQNPHIHHFFILSVSISKEKRVERLG